MQAKFLHGIKKYPIELIFHAPPAIFLSQFYYIPNLLVKLKNNPSILYCENIDQWTTNIGFPDCNSYDG